MARVQGSLLALALVVVAAMLTTASGARYTVGQPGGSWNTQTNLTAWASSINFKTGDELLFNYSVAAHNVMEVNSSSYRTCSVENPMAIFRTGNDAIQLGRALTRYFICGVPGHCAAGMKVEVRVTATDCRRRRPVTRRQRRRISNGSDCPNSSSASSVSSGRVSYVLVIMVLLMTLGPMV